MKVRLLKKHDPKLNFLGSRCDTKNIDSYQSPEVQSNKFFRIIILANSFEPDQAFALTLQETRSIHDSMNILKLNILLYLHFINILNINTKN